GRPRPDPSGRAADDDGRQEGRGGPGLPVQREAVPQRMAGPRRADARLRRHRRQEEGDRRGQARPRPGPRRRQQEEPRADDQAARVRRRDQLVAAYAATPAVAAGLSPPPPSLPAYFF